MPPLQFARALACVDDQGKALRIPECADFQPLKADGWAEVMRVPFTGTGAQAHF